MEHKSMWTRLFAAFAAVLLTLGIAAPAFAAVTPDAKGTVTLSGIEKGAEVNAYQLIEVGYNGNDPSGAYFWNNDVAAWLKGNGYAELVDQNGAVTEKYDKEDKPLYGKLAGDIKAGKLALTPAGTATANGSDVSLELPQGGYLILVSNSAKYVYGTIVTNIYPTYKDGSWSLTTDSVNINVKRKEISIDKTADGEDHTGAQIGDEVKFKIDATVPGYPEGAKDTVFNIVDTMSQGLTFNDDIKVVGYKGSDKAELVEGTHYTKETRDGATFVLSFKYDQVKDFDKVEVTYTATLNEGAVVGPDGNTNNAKLEWNNNPFDENGFKPGDGTTDETDVYTYGLDILKVVKNDLDTKLTGAVFEAYDAKSNKLSFVAEGNGVYRLAKKGDAKTTTELAVGESGKNVGRLVLKGLDTGNYTLKEIKAPEGYALPSSTFDFTIADSQPDGTVDGTPSVDLNAGYVAGKVENSKGFALPTTGGAGTVAITAAGVLVMAGAGLYLVRSRKQQ